jgi:serine/threonine protein kinase
MIDGNWSMNNGIHYAASNIGQNPSKLISLFDCIALQESIPSKSNYFSAPCVDKSKVFSLCKVSESKYGEIVLGKYQTKSVLIKIIKTNFINSSRERFLSELNVLSRVNHVNIACVCAIQLDRLYFIQEHSDLGTLQDYFHTQTNDQILQK